MNPYKWPRILHPFSLHFLRPPPPLPPTTPSPRGPAPNPLPPTSHTYKTHSTLMSREASRNPPGDGWSSPFWAPELASPTPSPGPAFTEQFVPPVMSGDIDVRLFSIWDGFAEDGLESTMVDDQNLMDETIEHHGAAAISYTIVVNYVALTPSLNIQHCVALLWVQKHFRSPRLARTTV
jgi:hypothetical protein